MSYDYSSHLRDGETEAQGGETTCQGCTTKEQQDRDLKPLLNFLFTVCMMPDPGKGGGVLGGEGRGGEGGSEQDHV